MYVFKDTKKRANIYAPYTDAQGTRYPSMPMELVEEITDPVAPDDDLTFYNRVESEDAPYVTWVRKDQAEIDELIKTRAKDEIYTKERQELMPRAVREFMLMFMEQGFTQEQLQGNPGYVKVKAFDDDIKALRSQL